MNRQQQKLTNLLSMAARAGKIAAGEYAVTRAVNERTAILICLANDLAPDALDKYRKLAEQSKIPLIELPFTKSVLGNCIGKNERAAAAVCDGGFADAIKTSL